MPQPDVVAGIARQVLGAAEWTVEAITGKGQVNDVYAVRASTARAVIRTRSGHAAEAEYRKEAWCIAHAAERSIPGPRVLAVGRFDDTSYMIESLVPGASVEAGAAVWRRLGEFAAQIHSIPVSGFGEELADPDRGVFTAPLHDGFDGTWEGFIAYNLRALADPRDPLVRLGILTPSESRMARDRIEGLLGRGARFGLTHGDLHPRNTLVTPDGTVHLLDWGSARVDVVPHGEIVQLLRGGIGADDLRAFCEGYGQPLPEDIDTHLLLRVIDTCRWALDRAPDRLGDCAAQVRRVMQDRLRSG